MKFQNQVGGDKRGLTRRHAIGAGAFLTLSAPTSAAAAGPVGTGGKSVSSAVFDAATYNMLSTEHDDVYPGITWESRRRAFVRMICQSNHDPDLLAIQEGQERQQVDELHSMLGRRYANFTAEDNISPRTIIWKKKSFALIDGGTVELFDREVEGYSKQRHGLWVLLRHRRTWKRLMVLNVHFPAGATEELHALRYDAVQRIAELVTRSRGRYAGIPALVLGDFNSYYDTVIGGYPSGPKVLEELGIRESYSASPKRKRVNPDHASKVALVEGQATFGADGSKRLDYIHSYPADCIDVLDWRMVINFRGHSEVDLRTPVGSDHHPTVSRLRLT